MIPCDHVGVAHPGHAALRPDVGGHPLQRHHGDRARVLGDLRLLRRDHVHDHAALEHLGHPALDARGAQLGGGGLSASRGGRGLVERHGVPSRLSDRPAGGRGLCVRDEPARPSSATFTITNGAPRPSIPPRRTRRWYVSRERPGPCRRAPRRAAGPPSGGRRLPRLRVGDLEVDRRRGGAGQPQPAHEPARAQVQRVADGVVVHAPGDQDGLLDVRELGREPGGQQAGGRPRRAGG